MIRVLYWIVGLLALSLFVYRGSRLNTQIEKILTTRIVQIGATMTEVDKIQLADAIAKYSLEAEIDYRMIIAIIEQESTYRKNKPGLAGEYGYMQVLPIAQAEVVRVFGNAFDAPVLKLWDPHYNVKIGTFYYSHCLNRARGGLKHLGPAEWSPEQRALMFYNTGWRYTQAGFNYAKSVWHRYMAIKRMG